MKKITPIEAYTKLVNKRHRINPKIIMAIKESIDEGYCKILESNGFAKKIRSGYVRGDRRAKREGVKYSLYEIATPNAKNGHHG